MRLTNIDIIITFKLLVVFCLWIGANPVLNGLRKNCGSVRGGVY